jgi:hypothetical protein
MVLAKKDSRKERGDLVEYYRKAAGADVDEFRELVPPEVIKAEGGLDVFIEKVSLDKSGRIVKYDAKKHKDGESWDRIIPDMRRSALASYEEKVITKYNMMKQPSEFYSIKKSVLETPKAAPLPVHGGNPRDFTFLETHSAGKWAWREAEIDHSGRAIVDPLQATSRDNLLRWLSRAPAAGVKNNLVAPRKFLTPEVVELKAYGIELEDYERTASRDALIDLIANMDAVRIISAQQVGDDTLIDGFSKKVDINIANNFREAVKDAKGDEKLIVKAMAEALKQFWNTSKFIQ